MSKATILFPNRCRAEVAAAFSACCLNDFFGIVADAVCQLSDCRIQFERATDWRVIDYGLGWQRFDHALFVRSQLTGSREAGMNSEGGGGAYMSPSALLQILENDPRYQNSRAVPEDRSVTQ